MKPALAKGASSTGTEKSCSIVLRLYIADGSLASTRAQANLMAFCEQQATGRFKVEVVDILREPLRALSEGVLVTPTLVRLSPLPTVKIVGDLSDQATIFSALGLVDVRST
ncbi:MAG TPA: circadian clock KaiB family protein [Paucimonas sp.]|nr:circadian clock KaiB family protein [Paucimonas sp.]